MNERHVREIEIHREHYDTFCGGRFDIDQVGLSTRCDAMIEGSLLRKELFPRTSPELVNDFETPGCMNLVSKDCGFS
jgi:hypothetical protein